jgi:hypothetical protein
VRGWRITPAGRLLLGLLGICAVASVFAPPYPWGDLGGLVGLCLLLGILMNTFVGRTMATMSERERTAFFQRMYGAKRRRKD